MKYSLTASLLTLVGALLNQSAIAAQPQPISDFVSHPIYSSVKISPTGEYLAMTVDRGDQDVLTVMRTSDLKLI